MSKKPTRMALVERKKARIAPNSKFPQGVYTIHPPDKCDQTLRSRPIHLKRFTAYEGKEFGKVQEKDGIRKYLIPSKETCVYPKIMTKKEFEHFAQVAASYRGAASEEEKEREMERLIKESAQRKDAIRRMDMKRGSKGERLNEAEAEARKRTMHLLERAFNLQLEQEEEIKKCNKLILETKCRAIRDAQIAERNLIEKEMAKEEKRLNEALENERRWTIEEEERKIREDAVRRLKFAKTLKDQIQENEEQRILEFERKQEESRLINLNTRAWQQRELEKQKKKELENAKVRRQLAESNEQLKHFKDMEREENRVMDARIQEFQRLKVEREARLAEQQRAQQAKKEREKERIAARTLQAHEVQAQIDEINAARVQEEVEREWRRKEKEEALKKAEAQKMLKIAREEQINNKRIMQALEIERDRQEFEKVLAVQKEAFCREAQEKQKKQQQSLIHRSEILKQVNEKERERIAARQRTFEEGVAIRTEAEMRRKKLKEAMERKCKEMTENGVPRVYIDEVKRMIETV
ncbi:cilia- and flagella-associated protein 45 [Orussus abietinus]|uniref:cilia- and flagella-associated protein 45 n=1 Tax=Orussus abietinus TaxID=222816 RepID=UPI000626DD6C|nr:cilia- and flagella-associated protein 45 [Orussus abietinus]